MVTWMNIAKVCLNACCSLIYFVLFCKFCLCVLFTGKYFFEDYLIILNVFLSVGGGLTRLPGKKVMLAAFRLFF